MILLYTCYIICFVCLLGYVLIGQWFIGPLIVVLMFLLRENMLLRQKVDYLLAQDDVREAARALASRSAALKQVDRVKGLS